MKNNVIPTGKVILKFQLNFIGYLPGLAEIYNIIVFAKFDFSR